MSKVAVLGAGAWGTALAKVLADKQNPTFLWSHRADLALLINERRVNERYLPSAPLPPTLRATADLEEALSGATLVVLVVPSHAMREVVTIARPYIPARALICSATKGIENDSLMLMSEVLVDELGRAVEPRLSYLSGPSFAKEVAAGQPTAVVVAGKSNDETVAVQHAFATERLRVYQSDDVVGVEVGGALKNVVAIAAGAADGFGFGHNARAGLITRGLAEIARIAMVKGGSPLTLAGLSGLGDLVLTCTGELSRNRTVGYEMGRGRTLDDVLTHLGHVAEGVKTAKSAYDLGVKLDVDMPITTEVYRVLYEQKPPLQAVVDLMNRSLRKE
ncbi:NAD(P)H-dependent glycerol-3-phosphate dehydrogenase [Polyangium sp. y55x31]|uniref:NAD(P)H-dependent glycerol-3-phosphate dehydrogenase n=1 Tax=Polyangium sp. y55x31 TaxID=3042688 RepID=UPI0024828E3F|nr:NAD(P)H-dependent glycerol-3-phosphate dehydrogenase [Polyangium sp. y55x31]MDI1481880.1 NAD(P)H-dependent glycerol-3-phosphate dehydrogenase [Polyangium sp. y55x31]